MTKRHPCDNMSSVVNIICMREANNLGIGAENLADITVVFIYLTAHRQTEAENKFFPAKWMNKNVQQENVHFFVKCFLSCVKGFGRNFQRTFFWHWDIVAPLSSGHFSCSLFSTPANKDVNNLTFLKTCKAYICFCHNSSYHQRNKKIQQPDVAFCTKKYLKNLGNCCQPLWRHLEWAEFSIIYIWKNLTKFFIKMTQKWWQKLYSLEKFQGDQIMLHKLANSENGFTAIQVAHKFCFSKYLCQRNVSLPKQQPRFLAEQFSEARFPRRTKGLTKTVHKIFQKSLPHHLCNFNLLCFPLSVCIKLN